MSLKDIHIPSVLVTSTHTFSTEFVSPALAQSIRYDRGVGYFTSGWIKNNTKGLIPFIENGGIARMLTSPILLESDFEALAKGAEALDNAVLHDLLKKQVKDLADTLNKDILLALAWLVADRRLIFRIAIPTEKLQGGDFHDKIGIFIDQEGNKVSFSGGYNETAKGEINYDSIKTFKSWEPVLADFVEADHGRFNEIWESKNPNLRIYSLPASIKKKLIEYTRLGERPYRQTPAQYVYGDGKEGTIQLRPYQEAALEEWMANGFKGTLRMATGTGKTYTALFCIKEFCEREPYGIPIVLCPFKHLVTQWTNSIEKFGYKTVRCLDDSKVWSKELNTRTQKINIDRRLKLEPSTRFVAVSTYRAFYSSNFNSFMTSLKLPSMIVADEVHNLGTETSLRGLPKQAKYRLALSATPERFMDEDGTKGIFHYFGDVVYSLDLKEAIFKLKALTQYIYKIHTVQLTQQEFEEYRKITKKIAMLLSKDINAFNSTEFDTLLRNRANILNQASLKLEKLKKILSSFGEIDKMLVYCSPSQLTDVNNILVNEFGVTSHQITYREENNLRQDILSKFEQGIYQVITAIKCLDEGLDVPATNSAIILASSSNPKEFIQRRGRVLRKAEGKRKALIIDIMALPPTINHASYGSQSEYDAEKAILKRELTRIQYFASCADNKSQVINSLYDLASHYSLQHILMGDER